MRTDTVPIGYCIAVAYVAFCTATAVIGPRPARSTRFYWGFWAAFMINELPFLALYALAASSILAFVQGDLASPGGLAAFAVAVLTGAGLAVLVRRALPTGAVLRRALADDAGIWEGRALLHRLAAEGWVCVSANYRLEPAHHFPDAPSNSGQRQHVIEAAKLGR